MAPHTRSFAFALALAATSVSAQTSKLTWAPTPLVDLDFPTPSDAPYKVWPDFPEYERGIQTGYNQCNSTTEGDKSLCQTSYFNSMEDFCIWAPPEPNSVIGDVEGEAVAWCTKKGYGTRLMTEGTIKGMQLLKHADYWMVTGRIDQTKLYIQAGDLGGELDSGSQDGRGNPIGGLMYSSAFAGSVRQVKWWTEFIGNDLFCIKICNPESGDKQHGFCQHTLDRIGLQYNCPSKYTFGEGFAEGDFEVCDTDPMDVPGIYVDEAGVTQSYKQPPDSLGPITTIPYEPTTVASRNCKQTPSSAIFTELAAATPVPGASSSSGAAASGGASATASGPSASVTAGASGSRTSGASGASTAGTSAPAQTDNAAARVVAGGAISAIVGAFAFVAFL